MQNYNSLIDILSSRSRENVKQPIAYTFLRSGTAMEESRTYEELDKQARLIAAAIQAQGLKKGDRAILVYVPGLALIDAFFGCLYAGVIAVPVYPPTNDKLIEKMQRIIKNSKPKLIMTTLDYFDKFGSLPTLPHLITDKLAEEAIPTWQPVSISSDDIAFIQYTSGSTAYPKGVIISHGNLLDNSANIYQAFGMDSNTVLLSWLPPYHDMGLIGAILNPIYGGYRAYYMTPFSFLQNPLSWLNYIDKYKITVTGGPNFSYDYCVKRIKEEKKQGLDLSSWKVAFNGAEPVHEETMERFYQAFKAYGFRKEAFFPCYGLAEATLLVTGGTPGVAFNSVKIAKEHFKDHRVHFVNSSKAVHQHLVSSGRMVQSVKIVDPETLQLCSKDMVGEIWVNSPSVAHGYWKQAEETEHAFHGKMAGDTSGVLYLRTGDLGFIHDDELYVTGRIKDLIILYGKNHYPQDIEYTLHHTHPVHKELGSTAAFVTNVDGEYRLTVMCEAKKRHLEKEAQDLLFTTIFEAIYQEHQLETHRIVLIPPKKIPKTTSGKIRRHYCRQQLLAQTIPMIATWELTDDRV